MKTWQITVGHVDGSTRSGQLRAETAERALLVAVSALDIPSAEVVWALVAPVQDGLKFVREEVKPC